MKKYIFCLTVVCIFFIACKNKPVEKIALSSDYYTCSMDPQVREFKPGKCPICKMNLTLVHKKSDTFKDAIELSEQQIQLGNIQIDTIRSSSIGDQLVLTATLNFNQMKATALSARVSGRIEKIYFKNIGDHVKKGEPLYELHSEELNNAQQEYLLALEKKRKFSSDETINYDQLLQSAKNKLQLWGMQNEQILLLDKTKTYSTNTTFYSTATGYITALEIKEGDYLMEGAAIVKLADLSTLWVDAQVYTSQMASIDKNSSVTVQFPDFNGKEIQGTIDFINPEINPDTRINLIRVVINNPNQLLKPGMAAYVLLKNPKRKTLSLPIDAVIRDGNGATVWIKTDKNTFKSVKVSTGLETNDRIEIVSGLRTGDIVVISGAYLLHSELVFKN